MIMNIKGVCLAVALSTAALGSVGVVSARADTPADLNRESNEALRQLYQTNPTAAAIGHQARAILIFPKIVKAGFVFGGAYGEGELKQGERVDGYYNSVTGTWGLQAGAQSYSYVVFLMNRKAVDYIHATHGWEIGVGPTVVLVDAGMAKNLSTSTLKDDAYAFIFDQQGLMAGLTINGTKISHIHP
jgi:lipid-binding SYLF domain-containing protein